MNLRGGHAWRNGADKRIAPLETEGRHREDLLGNLLVKGESALKFAHMYAACHLLDLRGIVQLSIVEFSIGAPRQRFFGRVK